MKIYNLNINDIEYRGMGMNPDKYVSLKNSILLNGFKQPIIIDKKTGFVLDGFHRLVIAHELGIKSIPTIYMNNPTRQGLKRKIAILEKQFNGKISVFDCIYK